VIQVGKEAHAEIIKPPQGLQALVDEHEAWLGRGKKK